MMKKLLKFLTAIALVTLFLGCEITLFPDDVEDNIITVTNDTGFTIVYLQVVSTYDLDHGIYVGTPVNELGTSYLYSGGTWDINLDNYADANLTIFATDSEGDYWREDVYYTDDSVSLETFYGFGS